MIGHGRTRLKRRALQFPFLSGKVFSIKEYKGCRELEAASAAVSSRCFPAFKAKEKLWLVTSL
jgi:hypothetical protein